MVTLTQEMTPRPPDFMTGPVHLRDKASWLIELIVNDTNRAVIDIHEGDEIAVPHYEVSSIYFKRNLQRGQPAASRLGKLRPFGLIHDVVPGGDALELSRHLQCDAPVRTRAAEAAK